MAPPIKRRKQSGQRSGFGSLTYIGCRKQWVVLGYERTPEGKVRRPVLHRFDREHIITRPQAEEEFQRWLTLKKREAAIYRRGAVYCVRNLCDAFVERAKAIYQRGDDMAQHWGFDKATANQWAMAQGSIRLAEYDGNHFRAFRDALDRIAASPATSKKRQVTTREGVNKKLKACRRIVKWAISASLCDPNLLPLLEAVEPLRKANALSKDGKGRTACSVDAYEAAVEHMRPHWRPVAILQRWGGGARPSEILSLRADEISVVEGLYMARKDAHKTAGKGITREIFFSPIANPEIEALLEDCTPDDPYLFSLRRWNAAMPGLMRKSAEQLSAHPGEDAYRDEVATACEYARRAGLECPTWTPYQLCHLRLGEIRAARGVEYARATRGHTSAVMTAQYVKEAEKEETRRLAVEAARVGVGD